MAEITALEKRPCPSCGGESVWHPEKQALVCPFCGTTTPVAERDGQIIEHDLVAALRSVPDDQRGWQTEKTSVKCRHCEAISVFDPARVGQRCEFCGSAQLVPHEETKLPFRPESLLAFKISETAVRDSLRAWYRKVWFAPSNLSKIAAADTVHGIYLPFWTFDAHVDASWTAEAGHYYYTTETFTDSKGKRSTRQVRHTRWVPASGSLSHFFDDELIPASKGVSRDLLTGVFPFPTADLIPYDPSFISGWTVEQYQIDLIEAAKHSRAQMDSAVEAMCEREVPGDTHRSLNVQSTYSAQTFKHILAPVWLVSYLYGARSFQVVVNGVTGEIRGAYPKSWIKITFAVIAALMVGCLILWLMQGAN